MILFTPYFSRTDSVYPTGIVDFMTMRTSGLTLRVHSMASSTADVSKK